MQDTVHAGHFGYSFLEHGGAYFQVDMPSIVSTEKNALVVAFTI